MTKLYLTLLLTLFFLPSQAQWVQRNDFNGSDRFAAIDFNVNGETYILGGLILSGSSYVGFDSYWRYDLPNDTWIEEGTFPGGTIYAGISFVIDDVAYIGLGADQNGVQNNYLWAFDSNTGQWSQMANFPGARRNFAFSFASAGKGYIGTGVNFTGGGLANLVDVWEYDPATNAWSQLSNYPGSGRVGLTAMTIDDFGHVGMGDDGATFFNDFWGYDPTNDNWTALTPFPGLNRSFYSTTSANGKGYLIGGQSVSGGYSNQMWSFEPIGMQWDPVFNFSGPSRAYGNFFYQDSAFYFGLGLIGPNDNQGTNDIWEYDLDPTGIFAHASSSQFKLFPNPTAGQFEIQLSPNSTLEKIRVFDPLMNLVYEGRESHVSLENAPAQLYLIEVTTSEGRAYSRLIKR